MEEQETSHESIRNEEHSEEEPEDEVGEICSKPPSD